MKSYRQQVAESAALVADQIRIRPLIGLLTGTGLGESMATLEKQVVFDCRDLPHFPVSTVQSHAGRLLVGTMANHPAVVMQGRLHLYEGYSPAQVTFPIRVMQALGVKILIVTNAAGGLVADWQAGDTMIISDHINLTAANPLTGPNHEAWGLRFPDMSTAYDCALSDLAREAGRQAGFRVHRGVYVGLPGPSLETPAEIRFLKTIGADAVGFSTVQEVIAAVHAGMRVLGLSTITNINDPDNPQPTSLERIIAAAQTAAPRIQVIIDQVLSAL